jgi:cytochrome c peroxidase
MNLAWQNQFFWDGGVLDLDHVPINAFTAPFEMNETLDHIIYKINKDSDYRSRFKAAFDVDSASTPQLLKAIAQFTVMIVSANSKYDKYKRGETGGTFTSAEQAGLQLFQAKCATCHKSEFFSDFSFRNNGMTVNTTDKGRSKITLNAVDDYKFKMPSLRNLSFTAPYMHDGSIGTLEAVVAQYATGVRNTAASLDPALIRPQGAGFGIPLSAAEQANIVAFLKTLDDDAFVHDTKFQ